MPINNAVTMQGKMGQTDAIATAYQKAPNYRALRCAFVPAWL